MNEYAKKVSVLIPCRNEVDAIENCLESIFSFKEPKGGFEVIVIDGMSDDGTKDVLDKQKKKFPSLIIINNPEQTVPNAMNIGIRVANGEFIVRTDVRCIHPKNYLVDLIALIEKTGADNVGGVLIPIGNSFFQKGIAASYKSRIAMGNALRERHNFYGETDTVYGGCFKKDKLIEIGMYNEDMVRNQDDELSFRLRKKKGKIIQSSKIKVFYYPRNNLKDLFKQYSQYGFWKVIVIRKHPGQASIRHLAPGVFLLSLFSLGINSFFDLHSLYGFGFLASSYVLTITIESIRIAFHTKIKYFPVVLSSIITIHISFGIGFIMGIICYFLKYIPNWYKSLSR